MILESQSQLLNKDKSLPTIIFSFTIYCQFCLLLSPRCSTGAMNCSTWIRSWKIRSQGPHAHGRTQARTILSKTGVPVKAKLCEKLKVSLSKTNKPTGQVLSTTFKTFTISQKRNWSVKSKCVLLLPVIMHGSMVDTSNHVVCPKYRKYKIWRQEGKKMSQVKGFDQEVNVQTDFLLLLTS